MRACDSRHLILDIAAPAGASRAFFRAEATGWVQVHTSRAPGCGAVRLRDASFPERLCLRLPGPR